MALLIALDGELSVVRTTGLGPAARRRIESWAREQESILAEPIEIDDLELHPDLGRVGIRLGKASLLAQPLIFKGRSLGVLVVFSAAEAPLGHEDRELIGAFTEQAAIALTNAHLFQTLLENATQDPLTELPNRREFDRLLARELERSSRYGEIFSLVILDVDGFKQMNDRHGHAAGDKLLRQAAGVFEDACRASDVAARIGGDEFALLLPETNQFEAAALCERLRAEVETLGEVSLSWGVAEYPTHGVAAPVLTRAADAAMYASKPQLAGAERVVERAQP